MQYSHGETNRRLNPIQGENFHPQHQSNQQPPQKCPRCDSYHTKFCYYNNYSLSQPRYFCKACRRYWTQGGTLRNVPVGGGCRKRSKRSSRTSYSGENLYPRQDSPANSTAVSGSGTTLSLGNKIPANFASPPAATIPFISSYYPAGGFLSSMAAMDQPLNFGGSSNMAVLQAFNVSQPQQQQFPPMGFSGGGKNMSMASLYPSGQNFVPRSKPESSRQGLHESFVGTTTQDQTVCAWPDLLGFGLPSQP